MPSNVEASVACRTVPSGVVTSTRHRTINCAGWTKIDTWIASPAATRAASRSGRNTLRRSIRFGAPGALVNMTPGASSAENHPPIPCTVAERPAVNATRPENERVSTLGSRVTRSAGGAMNSCGCR
jgi:hypothetical protein